MNVGYRGSGGYQQGRPPQQGGQRGPGPGGETFPHPTDTELRAIVQEGDAQKLVEVAQRLGQALARPPDQLTTSQIRAIFGTVREIEMSWPPTPGPSPDEQSRARRCQRELLLLRPKLAYQARRAPGHGVENLRQVLDPAIVLVGSDRERFQYFVDFFEAILAYHRYHGGQ